MIIALVRSAYTTQSEVGLSICGILQLQGDKLLMEAQKFLGEDFAMELLEIMYDGDLGEIKAKPAEELTGMEALIARTKGVNYVENYMPTTHLKQSV